jgi:hypothetical protein
MSAIHAFQVGQTVRLKNRFGIPPDAAENFLVTGRLPERNNSPQYRIRNESERHERVLTEDDLELADA